MFSKATRTLSILFICIFAIVAFAKPVDSDLIARSDDLIARSPVAAPVLETRCSTGTCTCTTQGCNEQAVLNILTTLQVTLNGIISTANSTSNPSAEVAAICTAINQAVALLAQVEVNISTSGGLLVDIVNILVAIVLALAQCAVKLGPSLSATLAAQLDAALALLLTTSTKLIPTLQSALQVALNADVNLLQTVKYQLTLLACNLPCGC